MSEVNEDNLRKKMEEAAHTAEHTITEVVQRIIDYYIEMGMDEALAQNQMLIALSNVTGHVLAAFPEDQRAFVESKVLENIPVQRQVHEAAYAKEESGIIDLATAEPAGRC